MGKLTIKTRSIGKNIGLSINYSHKAHIQPVPFTRTTGVVIAPSEFNKATGRIISRPDAAELNAKVAAVWKDVEYCLAECEKYKVEPFKQALDTEWEKLQQLKITRETTEPQAKRVLSRYLDVLRLELAELKESVRLKEKEIEEEEIKQNVHVSKLFINHIDEFLELNQTLKPNSKKNYTGLKEAVKLFNPNLNITDINKTNLNKFRDWLTTEKETRTIDLEATEQYALEHPDKPKNIYVKGLRNSSVREFLQKMKIVYSFFSEKFGYDVSSVKKWKSGLKKLQNKKVVFLNQAELDAVTTMPTETDQELIHRDFYVFMCNTGLRFCDALQVRKHHIEYNDNGELIIKILQQKTSKPVSIPVTADALRALEAHNFNFELNEVTGVGIKYTAQVGYFMNRMLERANICNYPLIRTNFKNNISKEADATLKRTLITSHTARKTFINISLKNGMDITAIKNIVGHSELNMIMDVYSDGSLDSAEMSKAGWKMPTTPTLSPVIGSNSKMKIA